MLFISRKYSTTENACHQNRMCSLTRPHTTHHTLPGAYHIYNLLLITAEGLVEQARVEVDLTAKNLLID